MKTTLEIWSALPPHLQTPIVQATGAVVAALLALGGVWATLSWNRRKHREDREFVLKKDCFAAYIAEINREVESWTSVWDDPQKIRDGQRRLAEANLWIVATTETMFSVAVVGQELNRIALLLQEKGEEHRALVQRNGSAIVAEDTDIGRNLRKHRVQFILLWDSLQNKFRENVYSDLIQAFRKELGLKAVPLQWFKKEFLFRARDEGSRKMAGTEDFEPL